jgi:hypothetical protein
MLKYDPERSEFAIASSFERAVQIVLLVLAVASAIVALGGGAGVTSQATWVSGALVALVAVFFVPNRRWRLTMVVVAVCLMIVGLIQR